MSGYFRLDYHVHMDAPADLLSVAERDGLRGVKSRKRSTICICTTQRSVTTPQADPEIATGSYRFPPNYARIALGEPNCGSLGSYGSTNERK
jgi:hypothetical protein